MNNSIKCLFIGPTKEQYDEIEIKQRIERDYMRFVRSNPDLPIEEYQKKYKSLQSLTDKKILT